MQTPNLFAIRVALETALFACLSEEQKKGNLVIVQPGTELKPNLKNIQVIHAVNPGDIQAGELGRQGVCPRLGVYTITLSVPPDDTVQLARAWQLCSTIEQTFYRVDLPIEGSDCAVMCNEPYTTNVGETDNRLALSVTVPWWAWAGGQEGE